MQEETFSSVAYHNAVRLLFSFSFEKGSALRHVDFENAFPSNILENTAYAKIPAQIFRDAQRKDGVLQLSTSLFGLKDIVRTLKKLLFQSLQEFILENVDTAPCVFEKGNMSLLCYVDDWISFA